MVQHLTLKLDHYNLFFRGGKSARKLLKFNLNKNLFNKIFTSRFLLRSCKSIWHTYNEGGTY